MIKSSDAYNFTSIKVESIFTNSVSISQTEARSFCKDCSLCATSRKKSECIEHKYKEGEENGKLQCNRR